MSYRLSERDQSQLKHLTHPVLFFANLWTICITICSTFSTICSTFGHHVINTKCFVIYSRFSQDNFLTRQQKQQNGNGTNTVMPSIKEKTEKTMQLLVRSTKDIQNSTFRPPEYSNPQPNKSLHFVFLQPFHSISFKHRSDKSAEDYIIVR